MAKVQIDSNNKVYVDSNNKILLTNGTTGIPRYKVDNGIASLESYNMSNSFTSLVSISQYAMDYAFYQNENVIGNVAFTNLEYVGKYGMQYAFQNTKLTGASFPKLEYVDDFGLFHAFLACPILGEISFPELKTATGSALSYVVASTRITTLRFPKLSSIQDVSVLSYCCQYCTNLENVYFNALTTKSFGTNKNQFSNFFSNTGSGVTHTMHFPSNLTSVVGALTGYPLFGGTSGYVTISFDLPATT